MNKSKKAEVAVRAALDKKHREWATFLRIPEPATSDIAPVLDPGWLAARGVNTGAEVVLRLLRDHVIPLIRMLESKHGLAGYHFLVHDRLSGVPTTEDDKSAFIHLRLTFKRPIDLIKAILPYAFELTRPVDGSRQSSIGGIDLSIVKGATSESRCEAVNRLINMQSAWVLALVEAHDWTGADAGSMVRQCLQIGHYLSNQLQMSFR